MNSKPKKKSILQRFGESQVWKSIIRSGVPRTRRQRMHAILGSVFLHLHPARLPKHAVKLGYTWCMGGLSFFLFVNLTITGILLMFYYRPVVEYAYTDVIDLEFCTGELNYIGNNKNPHYPDGDEISMLPLCFNASIDSEDILYSTYLSNTLKLYVANLGTTHHGDDKEHLLKINLAEIWQKSLENSNFISPVLHGTTGSTESTFSIASKSCFKINIAGSL